MNNEVAIRIDNLCKIYQLYDKPLDRLKEVFSSTKKFHKDFYALRDVSLEVQRGETLGIVGQNGSGKSTLLKIMTGVLSPTQGKLEVRGRVAALLELGAGFNPEYTGMENIFLQGSIMGYTENEMKQRLEEIIAFADIGDFIYQPVKTYSSGMFVRLAFAVNSCIEPEILIVDEALSVGDFFFVQKCYNKIEEIMKKGTAVVFVTHNMSDLVRFCNRAVLLDKGVCLHQGDPVYIMQKYLSLQRGVDNDLALEECQAQPIVVETQSERTDTNECLQDLKDALQEGNGRVICKSIRISDDKGNACNAFEMGADIVFHVVFEVVEDMEVPICGLDIVDSRNNIVHGKHALQYHHNSLGPVKKGSIIDYHQKIKLDVAPGEYSYVVGMAMIGENEYNNAGQVGYHELMMKMERVISISRVSVFSVVPRQEGQEIPFHGMCDLPGTCEMFLR